VRKDQFTTVLEAVRLARAEFRTHDMRRVKNAPRTLQRLREVLMEDRVTEALRLLGHGNEGPSVVPFQDHGERIDKATRSQSITSAIQACAVMSKYTLYGVHPLSLTRKETSTGFAPSATVNGTRIRPLLLSTKTGRRRRSIVYSPGH
jgi:hypothetical protein